MPTRTGRIYKGKVYKPRSRRVKRREMAEKESHVRTETPSAGTMEMAEVMRLLMEDRRSRERELREQMEMLRTMVEAGARRDAAGRTSDDKVKLSKLTESDDIEAYLTTFERMMAAYGIPNDRWSFKLAPMLTGRAQQAYAAMEPARAADYAEVKTAILRRYDISEETYRQRFRVAAKKEGEAYRELATRVEDLLERWTKSCKSVKELREVIVVEQFLNSLPIEIRVWVREWEPKTCAAAGELADTYIQARKSQPPRG